MFKTNFSVTAKFGRQCPPVVTGLGRGTKKVEDHWSIALISRVRTGYSNVRAKRSASESKNKVKQIYLRQYSVALSLAAAIVC